MPFIPATNVIQAEMIYLWDSQVVENVLHYQVGGGVTAQAMDDLGAELVGWWDVTMQPLSPTSLSLTEVRLTDLTSEFAPGASYTTGLPLVGSHASASMPNNVSISLSKRTAFRGRAYRGRIYHIGLMESVVTDNRVTTVHLAALIAAWTQMIEVFIDGQDCPMVVVSKYEGGDPRPSALVTPVTTIASDGIVDSQRRRLPRRGT